MKINILIPVLFLALLAVFSSGCLEPDTLVNPIRKVASSENFFIKDMAWRPSGGLALAVGTNERTDSATIYEFSDDGYKEIFYTDKISSFNCVSWHPSGQYALIGGDEGTLLKYEDGDVEYISGTAIFDINSICWKPNGAQALLAGERGTFLEYDHGDEQVRDTVTDETDHDGLNDINFKKVIVFKEYCFLLSADKLYAYHMNEKVFYDFIGSTYWIADIGPAPDHDELLVIGDDGRYTIISDSSFINTKGLVLIEENITGHKVNFSHMAWSRTEGFSIIAGVTPVGNISMFRYQGGKMELLPERTQRRLNDDVFGGGVDRIVKEPDTKYFHIVSDMSIYQFNPDMDWHDSYIIPGVSLVNFAGLLFIIIGLLCFSVYGAKQSAKANKHHNMDEELKRFDPGDDIEMEEPLAEIYEETVGLRLLYGAGERKNNGFVPSFVFFGLFFFVLFLVGSFFDGTLVIYGEGTGLLEDSFIFFTLIVISAVFFIFKKYVLDNVQPAFYSLRRALRKSKKRKDEEFSRVEREFRRILLFIRTYLQMDNTYPRLKLGKAMEYSIKFGGYGCVFLILYPRIWYSPVRDYWANSNNPLGFTAYALCVLAVFGYFVPWLLIYLFRIVLAMKHICRILTRNGLFNIIPFSPGKAGSLTTFGRLSIYMDYILIPPILAIVVFPFLRGDNSLNYYISILLMIAGGTLLFFLPLLGAHEAMKKAKHDEYDRLLREFTLNFDKLKNKLESDVETFDSDARNAHDNIERINSLYTRVENMPVWPFNLSIVSRFATIVGIPLVISILNLIIGLY
ncbi:MAG: WD40 repeat domain-containing protein [Candidatus Thermoplasmatota archaeon]|nr:WD40 repeat domain-containing protein [Candidatus Thermoplasmatota archaeon]